MPRLLPARAIVNVPWLALGTVYLLIGRRVGNAVLAGLLVFTGLATGVMLATPIHGEIPRDTLPVGKDHLDALPRAFAGIGSGLRAVVLITGALCRRCDSLGNALRETASSRSARVDRPRNARPVERRPRAGHRQT